MAMTTATTPRPSQVPSAPRSRRRRPPSPPSTKATRSPSPVRGDRPVDTGGDDLVGVAGGATVTAVVPVDEDIVGTVGSGASTRATSYRRDGAARVEPRWPIRSGPRDGADRACPDRGARPSPGP